MPIIYCITNKVNGKKYIGITRGTVSHRWAQHRHNAMASQTKSALHAAIRRYGCDAFSIESLRTVESDDEAISSEISEIASQRTLAPNGYNLSPGGSLPSLNGRRTRYWLGKKRAPDTVAKMRSAAIGRIPSERARALISAAHKGKKLSPEHRRLISESKRGALNPQFGKARPPEIRKRISAGMTGKRRDAAFSAKLSARMREKPTYAILNKDDVRAIRAAKSAGETGKSIATRYGVSQMTISAIWTGMRWGHVQ